MYYAQVEIEGIVPMKQNRVTERVIQDISGVGGKKLTPEEQEAEWEQKSYVNKKGEYYIPASHFQFSINNGMTTPVPIKSNKVKMSKQKAKGTVFVITDSVISNGKTKVVPQKDVTAINTKYGLTLQTRPCFDEGWKATFKLMVAQDWLTIEALKDGIVQAGQSHGLGSHRPQFGRFIIKSVKKVK